MSTAVSTTTTDAACYTFSVVYTRRTMTRTRTVRVSKFALAGRILSFDVYDKKKVVMHTHRQRVVVPPFSPRPAAIQEGKGNRTRRSAFFVLSCANRHLTQSSSCRCGGELSVPAHLLVVDGAWRQCVRLCGDCVATVLAMTKHIQTTRK